MNANKVQQRFTIYIKLYEIDIFYFLLIKLNAYITTLV